MTDWTDPATFGRVLDRADALEKGNYFEAFEEGSTIEHRPGLRLTRHGSELWASQTLNHQPQYWRTDAARERGYDEPPVHPDYLLACVMGPSVEALSEKGGYFLGRDDVTIHRVPLPGTEVRVESAVLATRRSGSRPAYGIVTWETTGVDAATGEVLVSYERTNMVPRREPAAGDGGDDGEDTGRDGDGGDAVDAGNAEDSEGTTDEQTERPTPDLPEEFVAPAGPYFEDFRDALEAAKGRDAAVAYRHERGRTMDDVLVSALPLATLNTARQHHDANAMADSPSGTTVAYGDVTRSVALGHARSDERTHRELGYDDERFHEFVTAGDTVYGFTRVLDADADVTERGVDGASLGGDADPDAAGWVEFEHVAFDQDRTPVYSGRRTALVERRD